MRPRFSLDGIPVERRALAPRKPFIVHLPLPVSSDAMFARLPGRGRFAAPDYVEWQARAALCLIAASPPRFKGAVWVAIAVEDSASFDDRARAVLELLVRERVIEDRARVRELRLCHAAIAGVRVSVRPFAFKAAP